MSLRCQTEYEVCEYVYNPDKGDPEHGIAAGTPLEDIPDGWICPRCRVAPGSNLKIEGGEKDG